MFKSKRIIGKTILLVVFAALLVLTTQLDSFGIIEDVTVTSTDTFEPVVIDRSNVVSAPTIEPLHITFVLDTSDVSYDAIKKGSVVNEIKKTLQKYSDQGHIVGVMAYRYDSTSKIEHASVSTGSTLWKSFSSFKITASMNYTGGPKHLRADYSYTTILTKGVKAMRDSAGNYKRVMVFISGNRDDKTAPTSAEKGELRQLLDENNINLYVIGLNPTVAGYTFSTNRALLYTDSKHLFTNVYSSNLSNILSSIIEKESFYDLSHIEAGESAVIELSPTSTQRSVCDASLRLYTTGKASYELIHHDAKDNHTDSYIVATGDTEGFITEITFDNINRINYSRAETLELKITSADPTSEVYYTFSSGECDRYFPDIITTYVNPYTYKSNELGFSVKGAILGLAAIPLAIFLVIIIIRTIKKINFTAVLKSYSENLSTSEKGAKVIRVLITPENESCCSYYFSITDTLLATAGDKGEFSLQTLLKGKDVHDEIKDYHFCNLNGRLYIRGGDSSEQFEPMITGKKYAVRINNDNHKIGYVKILDATM